jgi:hypothetical protein
VISKPVLKALGYLRRAPYHPQNLGGSRDKKSNMDQELDKFKSDIDLRAYAAEHGYQLDRKESWRGSAVMRNANGDKIIIKRGGDGHYLYFSVHRGDDNGSIIDFVQQRMRLSLGAVRKELRPWVGRAVSPAPFPELPKTNKDRIRVESEFSRMTDALRHPYLESERAIPVAFLEDPRFAGRIRIDARGNAIFPHFDQQGLCGFEIKNVGFTGFAAGGTKGLWSSNENQGDTSLVFCESAIDALSYAALFPDRHTRYASIGGQLNPLQPQLIREAILAMPKNSKIVSAMDADAQGAKLADIVREAVALSGRDDLAYVFQEPFGFKDWNDQLRSSNPTPFPTAQLPCPGLR